MVVEEISDYDARGKSFVSEPSPGRSRSPVPRRRPISEVRQPASSKSSSVAVRVKAEVYVPPHRRVAPELKEKAAEDVAKEEQPKAEKYVPPHKRRAEGPTGSCSVGGASSSKPAPAPYQVNVGSRSIVLGDLISKKLAEIEELKGKEPSDDDSNRLKVLESEVAGLRKSRQKLGER